MPATSQKFKFGSTEWELDLVSPKAPHEPLFVYVDDVLETFKIPNADRFEADGRTIVCVRDDNGTTLPCRPGCVIQVVYETSQSGPTFCELTTAAGTLVSLNESVNQLSITGDVSTDLGSSEPLRFGPSRVSTMQIQENMKTMTDAMKIMTNELITRRSGKLDVSTVHTIPEKSLSEYSRSMASTMTATPGIASIIINKLDGLHDQGHLTQQIVRQVLEETQQIKDRLTLIQSKTEAILTQQ
ncbi:hypothetical protein BG005_004788, partial [Podila minutissima]